MLPSLKGETGVPVGCGASGFGFQFSKPMEGDESRLPLLPFRAEQRPRASEIKCEK